MKWKMTIYSFVAILCFAGPALAVNCQHYEFGSLDSPVDVYADGRNWVFHAEHDMVVKFIKVKSFLSSPGVMLPLSELHFEIKVDDVIVASWQEFVNFRRQGYKIVTAVNLEVHAGSKIEYSISGGTQDSPGGVIFGPNYVRLCDGREVFQLSDTGQVKCYDEDEEIACPAAGSPFHGQDAKYPGIPSALRNNGDGTVTDLNTQLTWEQGDDHNASPRTWQDAFDYCAIRILAGHEDWRLPDLRELQSLLHFGRHDPAIDTDYFPGGLSAGYWAMTSYPFYSTPVYWMTDFSSGSTSPEAADSEHFVRCVRGSQSPESFYQHNGDDTVTDITTGLMWMQHGEFMPSWDEALDYCEGRTLAGYSDWRVPDVRELQSLVDTDRRPAIYAHFAIPASGSPFGPSPYLTYSSTTMDSAPQTALIVDFGDGLTSSADKWTSLPVRCVRGGPARSTTGVFRPDNGLIYLKNEHSTGFADASLLYGIAEDIPVTGDWDGDGVDSLGIYRDSMFYLKNTNETGFADMVFAFGQAGDLPVAGDWDGDGIDTIGIYRNGMFMLRNANSTGPPDMVFALGTLGDKPIAGDWDGNGGDSCGVFRPTDGSIFLKHDNTSGFADVAITFGIESDLPVMGDWDGDGVDTIGVYREGAFLLRNSNETGFAEMKFWLGTDGDVPISGRWGLP